MDDERRSQIEETIREHVAFTGSLRPATTRLFNEAVNEITRLRQSLEQARQLLEVMVTYHYWVPGAILDAARKWLEEHGDG